MNAERIRKAYSIISLAAMVLLTSLLCGCGNTDLPLGSYKFDDVVYAGGISSATYDALVETKAGTEYTIQKDSLSIKENDYETTFSDITYKQEELTADYIEKNYSPIAFFFEQYTHKYQFSIFDENEDRINYTIT